MENNPTVDESLKNNPTIDDPLRNNPTQDHPNSTKLSPAKTRFQNQGKNTISSIVGSYKSAVTKHAHRLGCEFAWQGRFHDHIIQDEEELERISEYVRHNVGNWKEGNDVDKCEFE